MKEQLDLVTNAGMLRTPKKATIPRWGNSWFNSVAITNLFSYAKMAQKNKIIYDSTKENEFVVHLPGNLIKFTKTLQGLYAYKPSMKKTSNKTILVKMVKEKRTFFTHC